MVAVELIYNLTVLIALSVLSGFIEARYNKYTFKGKIFQGVLFGATAITAMVHPFVVTEGIIFDGRSIVISLCALFFGPLSGVIASAAAVSYRLFIGGSGTLVGVLTILSSLIIGLSFYFYRTKSTDKKLTKTKLYLFGTIVHIAMLILFLWLPLDNFKDAYRLIATTVIVFYPLATLLIGKILMDQEESQKWHEKIKSSEQQFRSVWENSADGMRLTDAAGRIILANKALCDMVGIDKNELEGKLLSVMYSPEKHLQAVKKHVERFAGRSVDQHFEREMTLWNGKKVWFEVTNSFIELEKQPTMLLSIYRDITSRKQSEIELIQAKEKAEEMNRLKTNFLANLSHELRTPMIGILGYADILSEDLDKREHKEMAHTIRSSGERLLRTLNLLLDLSRIESNRDNIEKTVINIRKSVEKIADSFESYAVNKNLYIKTDIKDADLSLSLDERIFDQILSNLINNALKFTHEGGVTVKATQEIIDGSEWIAVKVIDTGIGISRENLKIIFDEFRQASEGLSRSYEGSGLGLTISKRSVELMGGVISVDSTEGAGSTFTVKFPSENSEIFAAKKITNLPINGNSTASSDHNILVVENDPVSSSFLKYLLRKYRSVDFAEDGKTAVRLASEKLYSVILMDIALDLEMNGIEAAAEIKKLNGYEESVFIAVTGFAMKGDREFFLSSGFDYYLSKPYDRKELLGIIKETLSTKK